MEALKVFLIGAGSAIPLVLVLFARYKYPHYDHGYVNCVISGFIGITTGFVVFKYLL